ncbi:hypothetical protein FOL47_011392, partial [Perkinsus chesapeaki]
PQQQQQWQQLQPLQQQQGQQLQPLQQQQGQQLQPLQQGQMQSQLLSDQGIQQFPTQEQPLQPPQAAAAPAAAPFMMPYEINEAPYRQQEPLMNSNPAPIPQLQADLIDTKANSSPKGGRLKDSATEGARNSTEGSKSKEMKERSTTFAWWSWMIIAFLSFLAIGGLLYYTDYMYHKQHYSGMPNKVLGQVVSAELRTKLDRACFVTVQCGKDDDTVLETRAVAGSGGVVHWNDHFRYSVSPEKARDHPLRKTAIKLTLYQNSDDGAKSLGSGEISCSSLKDVRMNGGVMEAHNVTISRFGIVIVKAGLGFSGWSEQKVDRLRASWRKKRSEISFWTRLLLSPAEATLLILKGIEGITHLHNFILSVFDLAVAATIVILTLPFLLNYVGLSMFDKLKIKELRWTWTTYSSLSGTGILLWRLFGTFPAFWHLGLYCGLGLLALLFMIADFRGESGSGVISRAVGKVAGWFAAHHSPGVSFAEPIITTLQRRPRSSLMQHLSNRAPPPPDDGSFDPRSGLPIVEPFKRLEMKLPNSHRGSLLAAGPEDYRREDGFPPPPEEIFESPELKERQEEVEAEAARLDDTNAEFTKDSRGIGWALRHSEMDNDQKEINTLTNRRMYRDPKRALFG